MIHIVLYNSTHLQVITSSEWSVLPSVGKLCYHARPQRG